MLRQYGRMISHGVLERSAGTQQVGVRKITERSAAGQQVDVRDLPEGSAPQVGVRELPLCTEKPHTSLGFHQQKSQSISESNLITSRCATIEEHGGINKPILRCAAFDPGSRRVEHGGMFY
jgi:hypothetical protein